MASALHDRGLGHSVPVCEWLGMVTQAWSGAMKKDMRAAILLLLAARCKGSLADTHAAGGSSSFVDMLSDSDPRIRHIAASFLQARPSW